MKKENLLIVCFTIEDLTKIHKVNLREYKNIIVASDDFRVHEACKKYELINDVTFLQKPIPYINVANSVITTIERINSFYEEVASELKIFEKEFMQLPYFIEGGDFAQKIQDALLYIESIDSICNTFEIMEVIVLSDSDKFISSIIKEYIDYRKLKYKVLERKVFTLNAKRIKYIIRPLNYLFRTILIKFLFLFEHKSKDNNVALTWLFSNTIQHIDNCLVLNNFMKLAGYNSIVYSWRVAKIADNRFNSNIKLERIEKYVDWFDIINSFILTMQVVLYSHKLNKLFNKYDFTYKNINIKTLMKPIALNYLLIESPDTYRFAQGFKKFSELLNIKLIGGAMSRYKLGIATEHLLPMNKIGKHIFSAFTMDESIYVKHSRRMYPSAYWDKANFFVQNEIDKNIVLNEVKLLENKVFVYGSFRGNKKVTKTREEVHSMYNLSKKYDYYILFDFSTQLFGYQSLEEILSCFNMLKRIFKDKENLLLMVKPHPSADISTLNLVNKNTTINNCIFLRRDDDVNYALRLSDVLITKCSTIGIEAMKYDTLVISYQLDGSDVFKLYGNNGNYVYSLDELKDTLEAIINNMDYKNTLLKTQKIFYEDTYSKGIDIDLVVNKLKNFQNE